MNYTETVLRQVWNKASTIPGEDRDYKRKDQCGATILWNQYGTSGNHGWEVDHIKPKSKGGSNQLYNLQPLHHENNAAKSNNYPKWSCAKDY